MAIDWKQERVAIVALTGQGVRLALQLRNEFPLSALFVPDRHSFAVAMGAHRFVRLKHVLPKLWEEYRAVVCIMATGIVVRLVAPLIHHKQCDPAVVVVDEKGQFVISLLSGHLGGANRLAKAVAGILGTQPVITTASDVQSKPALDLIARQAGLEIENPSMLPRLGRAILEQEPIWVYDPEQRLTPFLEGLSKVIEIMGRRPEDSEAIQFSDWLDGEHEEVLKELKTRREQIMREGERSGNESDFQGIWIAEYDPPTRPECLRLRPRNLVVGVGCNKGVGGEEILGLIRRVLARASLSLLSIRNLASVDLKAEEAGLLHAAGALRVPVHFYSREILRQVEVPNPSPGVAAHIGVHSVCEASAIVSAQNPCLVIPKCKTTNVTIAVGRVGSP